MEKYWREGKSQLYFKLVPIQIKFLYTTTLHLYYILKYVCHTSVVHMLWKLWSRFVFCLSKISMKIDISPILMTRFFFLSKHLNYIWTHMTETVPKIQFISDFISDIVSSLKLYFRRDTTEEKLSHILWHVNFCDLRHPLLRWVKI